MTIAKGPFEDAGFQAGQLLTVRAVGPGRVELTSLEALFEKHRGSIPTGGEWRRIVEEVHDEWD